MKIIEVVQALQREVDELRRANHDQALTIERLRTATQDRSGGSRRIAESPRRVYPEYGPFPLSQRLANNLRNYQVRSQADVLALDVGATGRWRNHGAQSRQELRELQASLRQLSEPAPDVLALAASTAGGAHLDTLRQIATVLDDLMAIVPKLTALHRTVQHAIGVAAPSAQGDSL